MSFSNQHAESLITEITEAIAKGSDALVVWGIDAEGIDLLSALSSCGLISFVSAVVDDRPEIQGRSYFGLEVRSPDDLVDIELDALVIASDRNKEKVLEEFSQADDRVPRTIFSGNANYEFGDSVFQDILGSCAVKPMAGGYPHMLIHLYQALKYVAQRGMTGSVAEFGVYKGGTTVFMAKVLRYYGFGGHIYGFDTFGGFPTARHVMDIYRDAKCEFLDYETVRVYCSPYNIELVPGDICTTFEKLRGIPLVLSFFDTDNYSPTRKALDLCVQQTVPGGVLAFDHFYSPEWGRTIGERIAIKQVLKDAKVFNLYGTGVFLKV